MSDDDPRNTPPQYPGQIPPGASPQPNWGSAYPPPGGYPPPPPGYPPSGGSDYPPAYGYPGHTPPPPKHPQATTAMVLGIVGLAGGVMCYLPFFVAPFGLHYGRKVMKEIDANPGRWSGRSEGKAGFILGIIGTVLLLLGLAVIVLLIVLIFTVDDFWDDDYDSYDGNDGFDAALTAGRAMVGSVFSR